MLTSAADIRHVLVGKAAHYLKTPRLTGRAGRERAGQGLLTSSGAEHRRQRLLMQPVFHQQVIEQFVDVIQHEAALFTERCMQGSEVDIAHEMSELALTVLTGVLFGTGFAQREAFAGAVKARRCYTEYVYHSPLPFRENLPTPTVIANRAAVKTIDRIIHEGIAARRSLRGEHGADMLSLLMEATSPDRTRMTDAQVRDEMLTLSSTGHETIGDALTWTWYLLGRHPHAEARVVAEIDDVLCGKPASAVDARALRYTSMVLSESMRLYPPTWIYTRVPVGDDVLPSGHRVKKGWTLYLCPYVMHRHPVYFPDPEAFVPERFGDGEERPKLVYFPFGAGPHTCIGEAMARFQAVLIIATIAQRVRFESASQLPVIPAAGITLSPANGIRMRVMVRHEALCP